MPPLRQFLLESLRSAAQGNAGDVVLSGAAGAALVVEAVEQLTAGDAVELAVRLAEAAWDMPVAGPTDVWWRNELARAGERACIVARQPGTLARLIGISADRARRAADEYSVAEAQWVRELALWRFLEEHREVTRAAGNPG